MKVYLRIVFVALSALMLIVSSCRNASRYNNLKDAFGNTALSDSIPNIDSLVASLPEYSQVTAPLMSNAKFNSDALFGLYPADETLAVKSSALLLGIYMADLGYARHYEQVQVCMDYLATMKLCAAELAIPAENFDYAVVACETALSDRESLLNMVDSAINSTNQYLRTGEMYGVAAIVASGLWLETLKIATQINADRETMNSILAGHQKQLETLNLLLESFSGDEYITKLANTLKDFSKISSDKLPGEKDFAEAYNQLGIKPVSAH